MNTKRLLLTKSGRPTIVLLVAGVVSALVLSGCAGGGVSSASSTHTLTIAAPSSPASLDPTKTATGNTQTMYQELAYASLLEKDDQGNIVAGLATKWGYVDGSQDTKFQLTLRAGAEFADGEPVTPQAVAASLNFFARGAGPTAASYKGWNATPQGTDEVLITSPTPNPVMADLLTPYNVGGNIIGPKGLANPTQLATATFGAGPYVYNAAQSVAGDHYTFVANKNYYDTSKVSFDKVVVKVISNNNSALQALRSGQIDVFNGDSTLVNSAKSDKLAVVSGAQQFGGVFISDWQGQLIPALGNQQVRQALNDAVDRDAIAKAVFGSFGRSTDQPNVPGWDGYSPSLEGTYTYDVNKAKSLLAQAGYPQGFSMSIVYAAFEPTTTKIAQAVADELSKVGVKVTLKSAANFTDFIGDLTSKKYSGFSLMWGGQTQFVNTNELWAKGSSTNIFSQEVDGLNTAFAAYTSSSDADRARAAQNVEKLLVDQAVTIPIAQSDTIWLANPKLAGFVLDPTGNPNNPVNWSLK